MLRLAVVTCALFGATLAKPPPLAKYAPAIKPFNTDPVPIPFHVKSQAKPSPLAKYAPAKSLNTDPVPVPFQGEPILFQDESERTTYTLPTGRYYFTTPYYPNNYINNYDWSFTVVGDNNQDVTITCDPFIMESHSSCGWDYLSINEVKYCGTNAPPTTTVSELRIRIYTDYSVVRTGTYCLVTVATGTTVTTTTSAPPPGDCSCGQSQTRIVGGTDATVGQFPWQAGIVSTGSTRSWCGGSVISNRYVMTAAHCTEGRSASQIQVMLGDLRSGIADAGEQRFSVQQIIHHPQYTQAWESGWDFSLLRLDRDIVFSDTIQPVCMPTAGQTYAGATAIASGYGRLGGSLPQATTLQNVQLPVWSQSSCTGVWGSYIKSSMICAGGSSEGGEAVCNGDSGGPLVTEVSGRFRLIGVVSWGPQGCAIANNPDVFARVTEALSWITSNAPNTCTP